MSEKKYPICPDSKMIPLIEMQQVPIYCNVLWDSREEARNAARGNIRLGYFAECGHVYNLDFDPSLMEYTQAYENSLHFSPRFQAYATALAERLIEQHDLHDKDIVEIGSGKGDFLIMLAKMGRNRGWGFDPSYVPDEAYTAENVTFIQDVYEEAYTSYKADFIVARHLLEHIEDPDTFIARVRRTVGNRPHTVVFFEVPNVLYTLRHLGIWDIIYEHCSYFSPYSLAEVFGRHGFRVLAVDEVFGGQFLTIEALPVDGETAVANPVSPAALQQLTRDARAFADNYRQKVATWQQNLAEIAASGQRAVVWGAGSKGVTFMNVLKAEGIDYVVDINPRKQGKFVAGTGQEIVPPDFLQTYQPDVVIIMNANYRQEIGKQLQDLGVGAKIMAA